jgi:hypothetical protein
MARLKGFAWMQWQTRFEAAHDFHELHLAKCRARQERRAAKMSTVGGSSPSVKSWLTDCGKS